MPPYCLFSLSPKIHPENILSAQLWVHLRPVDLVTTVFLQISRLKPGREGNSTRVRVRSLKIDTDAGTGSWQNIDIKSLLQTWLRQPESNYGIEINAYDPKGDNLAVTSVEPGEEGLVSSFNKISDDSDRDLDSKTILFCSFSWMFLLSSAGQLNAVTNASRCGVL